MIDRNVRPSRANAIAAARPMPKIPARHQGLAAGEPTRPAIGCLAVVGTRIHPARKSGPRPLLPAKGRLWILASRVSQSFRSRRLALLSTGRLLRALRKCRRRGRDKAHAANANNGASGIGKAFV